MFFWVRSINTSFLYYSDLEVLACNLVSVSVSMHIYSFQVLKLAVFFFTTSPAGWTLLWAQITGGNCCHYSSLLSAIFKFLLVSILTRDRDICYLHTIFSSRWIALGAGRGSTSPLCEPRDNPRQEWRHPWESPWQTRHWFPEKGIGCDQRSPWPGDSDRTWKVLD